MCDGSVELGGEVGVGGGELGLAVGRRSHPGPPRSSPLGPLAGASASSVRSAGSGPRRAATQRLAEGTGVPPSVRVQPPPSPRDSVWPPAPAPGPAGRAVSGSRPASSPLLSRLLARAAPSPPGRPAWQGRGAKCVADVLGVRGRLCADRQFPDSPARPGLCAFSSPHARRPGVGEVSSEPVADLGARRARAGGWSARGWRRASSAALTVRWPRRDGQSGREDHGRAASGRCRLMSPLRPGSAALLGGDVVPARALRDDARRPPEPDVAVVKGCHGRPWPLR